METVSVTIDGKNYRMACNKGQESHLIALAAQLDQYITHLKKNFGEIGDHRLSVMAGIMIIDEMEEIKRENKKLQEDYDALLRLHNEKERAMGRIMRDTTQRIEKLTNQLLKDDQNSKNIQEQEQEDF
ncbi:cell division protein ZapA [Bartonella krasnovii]|uniref:Cell division protein ZapA n=1 Tax=Bartonella krasnovii TaxID=2267275 RepID=A0A5B9D3F0_9HYPH|nr:cell division protein ZapA [Bartonella krasnovii]QEE12827.1 cell division protein ZapA [Bartonella krasnovii]UNF28943.1 cell division protein ZapA [Bartonella krasnovii]UNF35306.1 cell division protein ZapA [Bartonella krasnovii]UNF36936.1 cell division protein ZapA [Bartonella krasnovii]UNF38623.1 cell division protein ZapA [Bartonella krasnovii]